MRDLYVSSFAPTLGTGRALRTYTCVRALAELGPLDMAYVPFEGFHPSPEYLAIEGVAFHEIRPSRGIRRAATYARKRLAGGPHEFTRGVSPELIEVSERLARLPGRGRVVAGDLSASLALYPLGLRVPITYNAHNVESSYSYSGHGDKPLSRLTIRSFERRLLRRATESWMVSRGDLAAASALAPGARLRYVPNVVDVAGIRPATPAGAGRTVVMIGDFAYPPNRTGLDFLVSSVMPHVWGELPEARLRVFGRALGPDAVADPRVEVAGFIDDIADAYAEADCIAVPLVEGAGTPLKFVEALAYGMPVVATPLAAKGLEVTPGEHYLEGADPRSFAAGVVTALRDGQSALGARARELAEREYSIAALAERIAA